jgi:hydroxymethylpyrimidine/phosphomethylpyrimidine kinase
MHIDRPIVLSIAGLDPSGGAGLLADAKTFERHKVYGLGVCTAQTLQTESEFMSIRWEKPQDILAAVEKMLMHYEVKAVKIGIAENINVLQKIVSCIYSANKELKIIVDPIIKTGTGFRFWNNGIEKGKLNELLSMIYLLTPNFHEIKELYPELDERDAAEELSRYCNVLLKGGHNTSEPATDYLFMKGEAERIIPESVTIYSKHGSGCVLSSAITANLALGFDLIASCKLAKKYIEEFLASNETLLGYHCI